MASISVIAVFVAATVPTRTTYAESTYPSITNAYVRYDPDVTAYRPFISDSEPVTARYAYRPFRYLCGAGTAPVTSRNGSDPLHGYNGQHGSNHENPNPAVER